MLGLSFTPARAPATLSASPPGLNQKSKPKSPLTRTFRKLKKIMTRSGSKETVSASNNGSTHQKQGVGRQPQGASKPTADTSKVLPPIPLTPIQPTTKASPRHLPRTHGRVASARPTAATAAPTLSNSALLSNPSELDRFLAQYPKPKIVYTQAEAKKVVEAFVANAKYEEDHARKTDLSQKGPKPREERPSRWGGSREAQMTSSKYSAHATGCHLQAASKPTVATGNPPPPRPSARTKSTTKPGPRHLSRTTDGVASSLTIPKIASSIPAIRAPLPNRYNPDRSSPRPKIVYAGAEAKAVVEDIRKSQKAGIHEGWQDAIRKVGSSSKFESLPMAGCSITMDEMDMIMQDPTQMEPVWNKANVSSRPCEHHAGLKPFRPSATAKQSAKQDIERRDRARGLAYLKLVGELQ